MIRLLIDKLGDGHDDLFLKIDIIPSLVIVADSYYLLDFLNVEKENIGNESLLAYGASRLLDYWTERLESIEKGQSKFIPFELWDECIGGFEIRKTKLGYKIKRFSIYNIGGYEVDISTFDALIEAKKSSLVYDEDKEWLVSEKAIKEGFEWSKNELKKQNC